MNPPHFFIESLGMFNIKKINKESLTTLLDLVFNDLSQRVEQKNKDKISYETFSLYYQLPIFISKCIFNCFVKNEEQFITKQEFISNMVDLYCGEPETKLHLFFKFLDLDCDGFINAEDVTVILYQFHFVLSEIEPEIILKIIYNSNLFYESKQNVTLQEFVEINKNANSDLFVLLSFFFYKTKPFSNHFLNLYFEMTPTQKRHDTSFPMKYHISNKLKTYLKCISGENKDIIYDRKLSMTDLHKVIDSVKVRFDLHNINETHLINNLDTFSKSVGAVQSGFTPKENTNINDVIPRIEYINYTRSENKHFTETASTQCEDTDMYLHTVHYDFNINSNENEICEHCMTSRGSSSKTVTNCLFKCGNGQSNCEGHINAYVYSYKLNGIAMNVVCDVYDSSLLIFMNSIQNATNCNETRCMFNNSNIAQIIDLRYSYIDLLPTIVKDNKTYHQIEIGVCFCNINSFNNSNSLSNRICLLFEELSNDYTLFLEKLSSYNLLHLFNHQYELKECIGKGAYGNVFRTINKTTKLEYAVKIIQKNKLNPNNIKYIYQEINILKLLKNFNHKNIIKPKDFYENSEYIFLIFEYIPFGDLGDFIQRHTRSMTSSLIKSISEQLVSSIKFLHSVGIVHRDLKLNNIMCSRDDNGKIIIKLIDFGFSTVMTKNQLSNEIVGTLHYMPPEIINKEEYNMKVDIWSCGVILYYLRYSRFPFDDSRRKITILYQLIRMGRFMFGNVKYDFTKEQDMQYKQILLKCLQVNPERRISIQQLCEEKWFNDNNN